MIAFYAKNGEKTEKKTVMDKKATQLSIIVSTIA